MGSIQDEPAATRVEVQESHGTNSAPSEGTPLLGQTHDQQDGEIHECPESSLWGRVASPAWILVPMTLFTAALGGSNPSKQTLMMDLVCRDILRGKEEHAIHNGTTSFDYVDKECQVPEFGVRFGILTAVLALVGGGLCIFTVGKICALSDRYGRKFSLLVAMIGTIASEIVTLCAAQWPERFPTYLLILGAVLEGLCGFVFVTTSITSSYLRDCTTPEKRNTAFAYQHGCLALGLTVGPYLAGLLVQKTGSIAPVFYMLVSVHFAVILFIWVAVPESLPEASQLPISGVLRESRPQAFRLRTICSGIFAFGSFSTKPAVQRNIICLAVIDALVFAIGLGSASIVPYAFFKFGWQAVEIGHLVTISYCTGMIANFLVLPTLSWLFAPKQEKDSTCTAFDLGLIRSSLCVTALGYIGYAVAPSWTFLLLSSGVVYLGSITAPVVMASLTKHVPADQTGRLLGVLGQIHAIGRFFVPVIFDLTFSVSFELQLPWMVFVLLAVALIGGVGVSLGVRTMVSIDDEASHDEA